MYEVYGENRFRTYFGCIIDEHIFITPENVRVGVVILEIGIRK